MPVKIISYLYFYRLDRGASTMLSLSLFPIAFAAVWSETSGAFTANSCYSVQVQEPSTGNYLHLGWDTSAPLLNVQGSPSGDTFSFTLCLFTENSASPNYATLRNQHDYANTCSGGNCKYYLKQNPSGDSMLFQDSETSVTSSSDSRVLSYGYSGSNRSFRRSSSGFFVNGNVAPSLVQYRSNSQYWTFIPSGSYSSIAVGTLTSTSSPARKRRAFASQTARDKTDISFDESGSDIRGLKDKSNRRSDFAVKTFNVRRNAVLTDSGSQVIDGKAYAFGEPGTRRHFEMENVNNEPVFEGKWVTEKNLTIPYAKVSLQDHDSSVEDQTLLDSRIFIADASKVDGEVLLCAANAPDLCLAVFEKDGSHRLIVTRVVDSQFLSYTFVDPANAFKTNVPL